MARFRHPVDDETKRPLLVGANACDREGEAADAEEGRGLRPVAHSRLAPNSPGSVRRTVTAR